MWRVCCQDDLTLISKLTVCQETLESRLSDLREKQRECEKQMREKRMSKENTLLRRLIMEYKAIKRDILVTENTLFICDRQIGLIERNELDTLVVETLKSSSNALSELNTDPNMLQTVEEITEQLQNRMSEMDEINETMGSALNRGVEEVCASCVFFFFSGKLTRS